MIPLTFTTKHKLGTWCTNEIEAYRGTGGYKDFSLTERIELTFSKVHPYSGKIDPAIHITAQGQGGTANEVYQALLVTQPSYLKGGMLKPLVLPVRTHTARDGIGELFIPMNRRDLYDDESNCVARVINRILCFVFEVFTLIVRVFTFIPMAIYNASKAPHPAKQYFPNEEAVFVECKKNWTLNVIEDEGLENSIANMEAVFYWRVDFYAPLQTGFQWNDRSYALDVNSSDRERVVLCDENFISSANNFRNKEYGEGRAPFRQDPTLFLYQALETLVIKPTVTFC